MTDEEYYQKCAEMVFDKKRAYDIINLKSKRLKLVKALNSIDKVISETETKRALSILDRHVTREEEK